MPATAGSSTRSPGPASSGGPPRRGRELSASGVPDARPGTRLTPWPCWPTRHSPRRRPRSTCWELTSHARGSGHRGGRPVRRAGSAGAGTVTAWSLLPPAARRQLPRPRPAAPPVPLPSAQPRAGENPPARRNRLRPSYLQERADVLPGAARVPGDRLAGTVVAARWPAPARGRGCAPAAWPPRGAGPRRARRLAAGPRRDLPARTPPPSREQQLAAALDAAGKGDRDDALLQVTSLLADRPLDADAHFIHGLVALEAGDPAGAARRAAARALHQLPVHSRRVRPRPCL